MKEKALNTLLKTKTPAATIGNEIANLLKIERWAVKVSWKNSKNGKEKHLIVQLQLTRQENEEWWELKTREEQAKALVISNKEKWGVEFWTYQEEKHFLISVSFKNLALDRLATALNKLVKNKKQRSIKGQFA